MQSTTTMRFTLFDVIAFAVFATLVVIDVTISGYLLAR